MHQMVMCQGVVMSHMHVYVMQHGPESIRAAEQLSRRMPELALICAS
jgi:hypothetical protein